MPQRLKDDVRQNILRSAAHVFAEKGYGAATLAEVAQGAHVTTSNIYKYFPNKEGLLNALVTPTIASRLLRLVRARIRELAIRENWSSGQADQSRPAQELLSFWIEHRLAVLILLRGADGTRFDHIRDVLIREMERLSLRFLERQSHGETASPEVRFVLVRLFTNTIDMIADILENFENRDGIRAAFAAFWTYQLAGLQAMLHPEKPGRTPS
ncbi:TPA: TetR/AcrR family transcriptional regulator, partial [Escherichia coli]